MSADATTPTTELTGAALLREAARQMRERAQGVMLAQGAPDAWYDADELAGHLEYGGITSESIGPDSRHIASWHPAVALAVASGCESAERHVAADYAGCCEPPERCPEVAPWLAVARAYLGLS